MAEVYVKMEGGQLSGVRGPVGRYRFAVLVNVEHGQVG
jgi:hypothetical protein